MASTDPRVSFMPREGRNGKEEGTERWWWWCDGDGDGDGDGNDGAH